jgi:hypothetical protein
MPTFANNLLSMGVFCDAGCTVVFTREAVTVSNSAGSKIMQGWRETNGARMWRFNLTSATAASATQRAPTVLPNIILDDDDDDDSDDYNSISTPISETEKDALLAPPQISPIVHNSTPNSTPT